MDTATIVVPNVVERRITVPRETGTRYLLQVAYEDEKDWEIEESTSFATLARLAAEFFASGLCPITLTFSIMSGAAEYNPYGPVRKQRIKVPAVDQSIEYRMHCPESGEELYCSDMLTLLYRIGTGFHGWQSWVLTAHATGKPSGPLPEPPEPVKTYTLEVDIRVVQKVTEADLNNREVARDIERMMPPGLEHHIVSVKLRDGRKIVESRTYVPIR